MIKFVGDRKINAVIKNKEDMAAIQRDMDHLVNWVCLNKFWFYIVLFFPFFFYI